MMNRRELEKMLQHLKAEYMEALERGNERIQNNIVNQILNLEVTLKEDEFKNNMKEVKVDEEVDSMIESFAGGDFEVESFVSDKNTDVESVQFVIQTEAIKKEAVKVVEEKTEELNFWQKLLNLFRK